LKHDEQKYQKYDRAAMLNLVQRRSGGSMPVIPFEEWPVEIEGIGQKIAQHNRSSPETLRRHRGLQKRLNLFTLPPEKIQRYSIHVHHV